MAKQRRIRQTTDVDQLSLFGAPEPVVTTIVQPLPCAPGRHVWISAEQLSFDNEFHFQVEYCCCCGVYRKSEED